MALKLPVKETETKPKVVEPNVQPDALSPEDTIEYGITMEVSIDQGRKAWIKAGVSSSVRSGETTAQAEARVATYVEEMFERRIEEATG